MTYSITGHSKQVWNVPLYENLYLYSVSLVVLGTSTLHKKITYSSADMFGFFCVLLTVHLSIFILAVNQLDAQNFVLQ